MSREDYRKVEISYRLCQLKAERTICRDEANEWLRRLDFIKDKIEDLEEELRLIGEGQQMLPLEEEEWIANK